MLKSTVRITLIISGLAILLASCQTTITTTTRSSLPSTYKLVREFANVSRFPDDDLSIVRIDSGNVHFVRYGDFRDNNNIRGKLVLGKRKDTEVKNDYGTISEGKANVGDGYIDDFYSYVDKDYPELYADVVYIVGGGEFVEVGGERHVSIPRGSLTYTGTNIFGVVGSRRVNRWGEYVTDGTFTMTVDFDAGTGQIDGTTPSIVSQGSTILDASSISGSFGVNTETGTFSGERLTVRNLESRGQYDTVIYGSFHGSGAGGVTGVYVEKHDNPNFFGAIVGVAD